jgi:metallopeptidase MepB
MVSDKYKKPPQAPPVFTGTKDSIVSDAKKISEVTRTLLDKVVADVSADKANFENVLGPIVADENEGALQSRILGFYQYVAESAELREASTEADKHMDEFGIECAMREDVFKLVEAAHATKDSQNLDPESLRLIEKDYKGYIKFGLGLPAGPQRDRFKEIKKRLSQIQIEFQRNLNEETGGLWFTKEELDGVPSDVVDNLEKGKEGSEHDGKVKLTFKYPDLFPTLKYAKNADTRRKVFINNENKCNQNVPLFQEAVVLRDEAARLLGYPNHAQLRIEDKMAKDTKTVNDFLGDLRSRLTAGGAKEVQHLLDLKKKDTESRGVPYDGNYYLWDHKFYDRLMIEEEYSIDETKIAEYFPITSTITGMLKIFEELLGFSFIEVGPEDRDAISPTGSGKDIAWHQDVILFSVSSDTCTLTCTPARASTATPPTSTCSRASCTATEPAATPPPPWCATSASPLPASRLCSSTTRLSPSSTSSATASTTWPAAPSTAASTVPALLGTLSRPRRRCWRTGAGRLAC